MQNKIKIVDNAIRVDMSRLRKFIIDKWQSGQLYKHFYDHGIRGENLYKFILGEIADFTDELAREMEKEAQNTFGPRESNLDWEDKYLKSDVRSIGFELLSFFKEAYKYPIEKLTYDDIPAILDFIETYTCDSLESWQNWEKHWSNIDYVARRQKLLG